VVIDAARYSAGAFAETWSHIGGSADPVGGADGARLHRWVLDPASGVVKEERLDDRDIEFPTFNEDRLGRASRFLYAVSSGAVVKYDTGTGTGRTRDLGARPGEAIFVPAAGARSEDDGWLLSIVTDHAGDGSELLVLGAADLDLVASVRLPRRVPAGFHGSWIADH
jgi:carotenoid cleavage dioxygenase